MLTTALAQRTRVPALALIALTGAIHLYGAPDNFHDAVYKGALFVANALGAALAAYGITRRERWGWLLGLAVAGGAFLGYVVSRTAGLPGLPPDVWGEPIGVAPLLIEGAFVALAGVVLGAQPSQIGQLTPHAAQRS